jgi:membrane protease YdiL (CAAX protease family)
VVSLVAFLAAFKFACWRSRTAGCDWLVWQPWRPWFLVVLLPLFVGTQVLSSELDNLTRMVLPMPKMIAEAFEQVLDTKHCWWGTTLGVVVAAPFTEEVLFRGLILRGFLQRYSVTKSIWISALLFGLLHLNPWQFIYSTLLGLLLGWLYLHTRSLGLCIFGHAVNNGMTVVVAGLGIEIPGYSRGGPGGPAELQPLWLDLAGVLLVLVGFVLTRRLMALNRDMAPPLPPPLCP